MTARKKKFPRVARDPKFYPITGKGCVHPKLETLTGKVRTMRAEILDATFRQTDKLGRVDNEYRLEATRLQVEINDLVSQAIMALNDASRKLHSFEERTSEDEEDETARDDADE